jgi:hypothetical protein
MGPPDISASPYTYTITGSLVQEDIPAGRKTFIVFKLEGFVAKSMGELNRKVPTAYGTPRKASKAQSIQLIPRTDFVPSGRATLICWRNSQKLNENRDHGQGQGNKYDQGMRCEGVGDAEQAKA